MGDSISESSSTGGSELFEDQQQDSSSEFGDCATSGSETFSELQTAEEVFRVRFLSEDYLTLDSDSIPLISNHINYFVSQCRSNESIDRVKLCPFPCAFDGQDDRDGDDEDEDIWDKIGQAVGNLQGLRQLHIDTNCFPDVECEYDDPGWEIVACILKHVRQKITLTVYPPKGSGWRAEDFRSFARTIHGHPTITCFEEQDMYPYISLDVLYSALATLPALESISLSNRGRKPLRENESNMAHQESLTRLLRVPSLRSVCFRNFYFTRALCQATANALMEGTAAVTMLVFVKCQFADGECATILANAFSRNTSVSHLEVVSPFDAVLCNALAMLLPSNATLRRLDLGINDDGPDLSPVFLALGKNTGLSTLKVYVYGSMGESLCTAMADGLGMNETLLSLELNERPSNENSAVWSRALAFLRTNKTLESLIVTLDDDETESVTESMTQSCASAFCIDLATVLQENASLVSLSIDSLYRIELKEYFVLVTALQHNTALKSLSINRELTIHLNDDYNKRIASLLKKNYALERLPDISHQGEDVGAILRLNAAGRRYLIEDGSSISKGVKVLSRVNDDINCVFLHLLDDPKLCDRRAVEMVAADESNGRSTSPTARAGSGGGKREQASAHKGNESRRRLA